MASKSENFYDANIALLEKNHPYAWKILSEYSAEEVGEIVPSPTGKPNFKIHTPEGQETYLHAPNDPEAEVPQFLNMISPDSTGFVNLLGIGLGYTALALVEQRPYLQHLVIFDLNPGIFKQALKSLDLSPLLIDKRVVLCIDPAPPVEEILGQFSRTLQLETVHNLKHLPSFAVDPEGYNKLYDAIFAVVNKFNLGGSTTMHLGYKFVANRMEHLKSIHHQFLLENLANAFQDVPAFIVAGGPSLDKNIHQLKQAKDKAVIIAVDGAVPVLHANGISPDFITTIDPHPSTWEKLASAAPSANKTSLICMSWANPRIPKTFPAEHVFWCFANNTLEGWILSLLEGSMLTGGAATVAHLNLTAALVLGCSPITFLGQDLSYSIESSHARNTAMTNQEEVRRLLKNKDTMIWVKGVSGEKVPTIRTFLDMKDHFERVIKAHPSRQYFNATAEGVDIEGTEVLPLDEVIQKYCVKEIPISEIIDNSVHGRPQSSSMKLVPPLKNMLKYIETVQKMINKTDSVTKKVVHEINALNEQKKRYTSFASLPQNLQKQINEIDLNHKKIDQKKKVWTILQEITMSGLQQSERLRQRISMIEGKPEKYLEWLSKNYERLDLINKVRTDVLSKFAAKINEVLSHYAKEQRLLKNNDSSKTEAHLLNLVDFYFENSFIVLAQPILTKLLETNPDSAELNYYLGCTAAVHTDYQKAENLFAKAEKCDPTITRKIEEFRAKLGTECLVCAEEYRAIGPETFKKLLLKGLRYCPNHPNIRVELSIMAANDIAKIEALCAANTPEESHKIIASWVHDLDNDANLKTVIPNDQMGRLYFYHSQMLLSQNDSQHALSSLIQGLTYAPNMAEIHFALTEVLFSLEEYDRGINHLNRAIEINNGYAHYWENIGDNLFQAENYQAALSAYENCFKLLPDNTILLKKISDCYMALDQFEAAHAALNFYKERLATAVTEKETGAETNLKISSQEVCGQQASSGSSC